MSQGILSGASKVKIRNSQLIDNSQTLNINNPAPDGRRFGLQRLLRHSIPEALHDSSARDPPPRCHPGTRYDYIDQIINWGLNNSEREHRMIWMHGPAGVGKSAVSQSCAEAFAGSGKLGAAFFFSRPNKRDKPNYFFTTIAYQLAMKNKLCAQILDTMLHENPTLLTKSIKQQFQDLIATPLKELKAQGEVFTELVIIVDGLDECASSRAQCEIIEIVATSIRNRTTPFLWIFVSRPEADIQATFASPRISPLSLRIEIPVSRDIDNEITKYLTDELKDIQRKHDLPEWWPSERQIGKLVNLSAGLFIYASTVIRFIKDNDSFGPDDQLHAVLALSENSTKENETHPLSELDFFYTLIMQRVPSKILPVIQRILLVTSFDIGADVRTHANILGLSEPQFRIACRSLTSVLRLHWYLDKVAIQFYHASFMEFLQNPRRSRNFCITSACATALCRDLMSKLSIVHAKSGPRARIDIPVTWPWTRLSQRDIYLLTVTTFLRLCRSMSPNHEVLAALATFTYAKIPVLLPPRFNSSVGIPTAKLFQKVPADLRRKFFRRCPRVLFHASILKMPEFSDWNRPYVLGCGSNKVLLWKNRLGGLYVCPYPSFGIVSVVEFVKSKIMGPRKHESEEALDPLHAED